MNSQIDDKTMWNVPLRGNEYIKVTMGSPRPGQNLSSAWQHHFMPLTVNVSAVEDTV